MHSLNYSLTEFLTNSKAPAPMRQVVFTLLIRILRRLRYMNSKVPIGNGISSEFVENLLKELIKWKDEE